MTLNAIDSIIQRLNVSDPEMNTAVGTPIRKIIDAVGDEINNMFVDTFLLQTSFDIGKYSGSDLDDLCSLFGFSRQAAKSGYGVITLTRDNADIEAYIPSGTQFVTSGAAPLVFSSVTDIYMNAGQPSARIPVISALPGSANNVPAGAINEILNRSIDCKITNPTAITGGQDAETDELLRERFRNTVFRSVTGTREQYLGIASTYDSVTAYRLFGMRNQSTEYLTVVDSGGALSATTQNRDIRDTYRPSAIGGKPMDVWVRRHETGDVLLRFSDFTTEWVTGDNNAIKVLFPYKEVVDEMFICEKGETAFLENSGININSLVIRTEPDNAGTDVTNLFDINDSTLVLQGDSAVNEFYASYAFSAVVENDIVVVTYDYDSTKRDIEHDSVIYIDGTRESSATDSRYIDFTNIERITNDNKNQWVRRDSGVAPTTGNAVIILGNTPVSSIENSISFAGVETLIKNVDYWLIKDVSATNGSIHAMDGIEIKMGAGTKVGVDTKVPATIEYTYNDVIENMQATINDVTPIATTCIVKEAKRRYFRIHLDVITQIHNKERTGALINDALNAFASELQIGSVLQVSDIVRAVSNTEGIDSCRLRYAINNDLVGGGIEEVSFAGENINNYSTDVLLDTDERAYIVGTNINLLTQEVW